MADPKPPLNSLKTGALSRGLSLARMSLSAGVRAAGHTVGNLFADEDGRAERLKTLLTTQAGALAKELGQLKGSVMKVGQMLSMVGEGVLPPEALALLRTLQNQAPPLAWPQIERVLRTELGQDKLAMLDIAQTAMASASLGQVHRAVHRESGEVIALKVQYPGVDKAIDSDLKALRSMLTVARLLPSNAQFDPIFEEVRSMLKQEVDYTRELTLTNNHRALVADDARYILPRTFPEFSTGRVMATSYEEGVAVDGPEVAAFSQERRNTLGLAAMELTLKELTQWQCMQTDPHFGNYRIRPGVDGAPDRIVMLDFGAVRVFPPEFLQKYFLLARGTLTQNVPLLEQGALALGLMTPDDGPRLRKAMLELCLSFTEPFGPPTPASAHLFTREGCYRWGDSDLPKRAIRIGSEWALAAGLRSPPREMVFLDRKLGGMFFFLATLKAVVNARPLVESYVLNATA